MGITTTHFHIRKGDDLLVTGDVSNPAQPAFFIRIEAANGGVGNAVTLVFAADPTTRLPAVGNLRQFAADVRRLVDELVAKYPGVRE